MILLPNLLYSGYRKLICPCLVAWCQNRFWPSDPLCEEAPRSSILSQAQLESLWELLPPLLEPATPQVLYDNSVHGYSLERMFARLQLAHGEIRNEPEIGE